MTKGMETAVRGDNPDDGSRRPVGGEVSEYHPKPRAGNIIPPVTVPDLAKLPIWAAWVETPDKTGRLGKPPINPATGWNASVTNPKTWGTRAAAEARAVKLLDDTGKLLSGVGLMLGAHDGLKRGWTLCAVDLDGCRDPQSRDVPLWARTVANRFASYTEISPSGTGLRIVFVAVTSQVDALRKKGLIPKSGREFSFGDHVGIAPYFGAKFMAITGNRRSYDDGVHGVDCGDLEWLLGDFGPKMKARRTSGNRSSGSSRGDDSGSGAGFRFACDRVRDGLNDYEIAEAFAEGDDRTQDGACDWWARSESQRDRTLANARARIAEEEAAVLDALDDISAQGGKDSVGGFKLDEDGVISAFTAAHKDELRFDHTAGSWYRFDGNAWRREDTRLAHHYARHLATSMAAADPTAKALRKVHVWEAIERGARTAREFVATSEDWNRDPWLLGTPKGTVDLRTGDVRAGDPKDHISRLTAAAPIPLDRFDAARDCSRWLAFVSEALDGDVDAIRFLRMWGGYCLTGETKEHALVFVYGRGGSGKSTAINTMADILGEYAVNVAASTLTAAKHDAHPEEIARLDGARLAWASETEKGRAWAENRIKSLTGGDKITARFMRQNSFEFSPQMKLVIVGNNAPALANVDEAVKRRFIILPFDHPPAQKDPDLPAKLRAEWTGILSWMIEGCLDWQRHGLVWPAVASRATDAYFAEQDVFGQWIDDCCESGEHLADTTAKLWDSWYAYASENGEDPGTKKRSFPETLAQRGFVAAKDNFGIRGRGWRGLHVTERDGVDAADLL